MDTVKGNGATGPDGRSYLTPGEVARILMVSSETVRQWAQKGRLPAETMSGGHRRFLRADVESFRAARARSAARDRGGPLRVLVLENDRADSGMLAALFTGLERPVRVQVARSALAAGHGLVAFRPHLLVVDPSLPGVDLLELRERVRADPALRGLRIVCVAGFLGGDGAEPRRAAGADAHLRRPVDTSDLARLVERLAPAG